MNIQQMHTAFRTMAQQAGLQLVRGILPEAIDVYINSEIFDVVRQEILLSAKTVHQETINTQPTALGAVNLLRSLYRTKAVKINKTPVIPPKSASAINPDIDPGAITKPSNAKTYNPEIGYYEVYVPKEDIDAMLYLGVSISYNKEFVEKLNRSLGSKGKGDNVGTRLIGGDILETTFRDYCNAASIENPVVSLMSDDNGKEYFEVYTNQKNLIIDSINIKYIKVPNSVYFDTDPDKCIDCDLPPYIHYEIVRRAATRFLSTIAGGQQQAQPSAQQN